MPFKANAARRHHIPKQKRKVINWAAYDASLRQRGSLTGIVTLTWGRRREGEDHCNEPVTLRFGCSFPGPRH
jgi:hypothetical protein